MLVKKWLVKKWIADNALIWNRTQQQRCAPSGHQRFITLLLFILTLGGCSTSQQDAEQPASVTSSGPALSTQPDAPARVFMRGQLIIGHETRTFQPCDSQAPYWVTLPEEVLARARTMVREPYQPLYAEVYGYFEPATAGFASAYSANFVTTGLNMLTAENPMRCQQPPRAAIAQGNEPFWSVQKTAQGVQINRPGQDPEDIRVISTTQNTQLTRYLWTNGSLTLRNQPCSDSMSDTVYPYSAMLLLDGKQLIGCGTDPAPQQYPQTGNYTQTLSQGIQISLNLYPDFRSETRYSYADQSDDVVESGYWQPLHSGLIQVVSTNYQGQNLVAVREFQQQQALLVTKEETINDQTYPLAEGGLRLQKQP